MRKNNRTLLGRFFLGCIFTVVLGVLALGCYHFFFRVFDEKAKLQEQQVQKDQQSEYRETEAQKLESKESGLTENDDTKYAKILNPVDKNEYAAYQDLEMYTYQDLSSDIKLLTQSYSGLAKVDTLAVTADGRNLYHVIVGNPAAEHKIFINGGIHGREYMTCQLVMKQLITYLDHIEQKDSYMFRGNEAVSYESMWENCVIHIIPMINPDGVTISQYGVIGLNNQEIRDQVEAIAMREGGFGDAYYYKRWKSNANGVDLNRNFDALWESYDDGVGMPSADHYKGTSIGCEIESSALIELTEKEMFDLSVSYHTQGSVIYWYFGQDGALYEDTKEVADLVSRLTGYPTDANYEYLDPAGYKDWCISKKGIPGLTIEIGTETSPVPSSQFDSIWYKNQYVWEELVQWVCN